MSALTGATGGRILGAVLLAISAAALLPAGAVAKQTRYGVIEEYPSPSHVGMIASNGPRNTVWFTEERRPAAIGRMTLSGQVKRFPLPAGVTPVDLAVSPAAAVYFTYTRGGVAALGTAEGGIGKVVRDKVVLFDVPPDPSGPPDQIVFTESWRVWFDHAGPFVPGGSGLGTINRKGEITEYGEGLQPGARITSMSGGYQDVWFVDDGPDRKIGRITQAGVITEFGGLPAAGPSTIAPLVALEAGTWFSANAAPPGLAVERIDAAGQITRFSKGLSSSAFALGPFVEGIGATAAWFRIQRHGGLGTAASPDGQLAIGRVTEGGKITEYSRCIRPMPAAAGIREMIRGPRNSVWYVNSPTGTPRHFRHLAMASIGQIDQHGKITEYRYGLYAYSEPEDLVGAGGILWFVDGHNGRIGELVAPRRPANGAQALRLLGGKGTKPRIEVEVPGPGKLLLKEVGQRPGLGTSMATARTCGPTTIAVPMSPPLIEELHRNGVAFIDSQLTFTPRGGTPLTSTIHIEVGVAGK